MGAAAAEISAAPRAELQGRAVPGAVRCSAPSHQFSALPLPCIAHAAGQQHPDTAVM